MNSTAGVSLSTEESEVMSHSGPRKRKSVPVTRLSEEITVSCHVTAGSMLYGTSQKSAP